MHGNSTRTYNAHFSLSLGTPEMLSPVSMEAPTPPPQPSPGAFTSPKQQQSSSQHIYSPKPYSSNSLNRMPGQQHRMIEAVTSPNYNTLPSGGMNGHMPLYNGDHHQPLQQQKMMSSPPNNHMSQSWGPGSQSNSSNVLNNNDLEYRPKQEEDLAQVR